MANLSDYIKEIEAATSGSEIRTEIVEALNYINESATSTSSIPEDTIKSICKR